MSSIFTWHTTPGNNNDSNNGFPEGMPGRQLNDNIREMQAQTKRWYVSVAGDDDTTNSGNDYSISPGMSYTAEAAGQYYEMRINAANTGACRLRVDGRAYRNLRGYGDRALTSGELQAGMYIGVVYTGAHFEIKWISADERKLNTDLSNVGTVSDAAGFRTAIGVTGTDISGKLDTDLGNVAASVSTGDASTFRSRISAAASSHTHDTRYIRQGDVDAIDEISQSDYDNLATKVADTLYLITS